MHLELDFLSMQPHLQLRQLEGKNYVFDPIRKKNIVLTPEELLRQLVVQYMLREKSYSPTRIRVEIGITVNELKKRCDVVVFDADLKPWLLVECKSPKVRLTQKTFEQAAAYNMQLEVPYMAITNGLSTFCCELDYVQKNYRFLSDFPEW